MKLRSLYLPFYLSKHWLLIWQFYMEMKYFHLKNGTLVFLKKVFVLQKISFKVKVLKTFKIFTICDVKRGRSLKRRPILKIRILEEPMLFILALIGKFRNRRNDILAQSLDISIQKRLCFEFE